MLQRELLVYLFKPASMQRWNSFLAPTPLTELDKHAHKLIAAYVLGQLERQAGRGPDWHRIVQASLFEYLRQTILPDIRFETSEYLMSRAGSHVVRFVCNALSPLLQGLSTDLQDDLTSYFTVRDSRYDLERRIVRAASWTATYWEFQHLVYPFNSLGTRIEVERTAILRRRQEHETLASMLKLHEMPDGTMNLRSFLGLCGELRYQSRWPQTPRVPMTSVLGHSYVVALLAFFISDQGEPRYDANRTYNNVFGALFHDLGEAVTGDIISPVRTAAPAIDSAICDFEQQELDARVMPCLPQDMQAEMRFWVRDVFENRVCRDGQTIVGFSNADLDNRRADPAEAILDGRLIGICDDLAALMEAALSIGHGVTSPDIEGGKSRLLARVRRGQITSQHEPDPVLLEYVRKRGFLAPFDYFA